MKDPIIRHNLHQLAAQAIPDDIDLWPAIGARLISSRKRRNSMVSNGLRRVLMYSAITLVVFAAVMLTVPPVRAGVLDFLRQLGGWIFTDGQTYAQQVVADPSPIPPVDPNDDEQVELLDIAESTERFGESIYVPSYIPEGYELNARGVQTTPDLSYIFTTYFNRADLSNFSIVQSKVKVQQQVAMGVQPIEVTVRGQSGLWFEQAPIEFWVYDQGNGNVTTQLKTRNVLAWTEGDIDMSISSSNLSLEETLRIAESLTK